MPMGQRLVVELIDNEQVLASVYFHWSAYFEPAIQELKFLSDDILEAEQTGENKLLAVLKGLEKRGGGVRISDMETVKEMFPEYNPSINGNRNDGLITFSQEGIRDWYYQAEGLADIDITTHKIRNMVWAEPEPFEIDVTATNEVCIKYKNNEYLLNLEEMSCESIQDLYEFLEKRFTSDDDELPDDELPY